MLIFLKIQTIELINQAEHNFSNSNKYEEILQDILKMNMIYINISCAML